MTVGIILQGKGSDVITARGTTPLRDICSTLAEKGIGAILVTDVADHIEGIISERDIVKTLAAKGPEALNLPASNVMTTAVVTCGEDDAIMDARYFFTVLAGTFEHFLMIVFRPALQGGQQVVSDRADVKLINSASARRSYPDTESVVTQFHLL